MDKVNSKIFQSSCFLTVTSHPIIDGKGFIEEKSKVAQRKGGLDLVHTMFCPIRCCLFEPYVAKDQKCQTSNKYLSYHNFRWEKCYWQQLIIFVHTVPWSRVANCSPGTSARAGLHISALTKSHIHGSASTVTYRRPPSKLWRIACNVDPKSIIAFHFHLWSTKELSLETFCVK